VRKRFLLGIILVAAACHGRGPVDPGSVSDGGQDAGADEGAPVGSTCDQNLDCAAELECITEIPDGFCTRECFVSCPGESLCVEVTMPDASAKHLCAPVCDTETPCRQGFECVSVGRKSVCSL
jgi:hypothetical protein